MNNIKKLSEIPAPHPIYISAGENAHEQTVLLFILDQLKHHPNEIIWVDPNKLYDICYIGEVNSEKLNVILKDENSKTILSKDELHEFEKQWKKLTGNESTLRIWEDDKVKNVQVSYFDEFILEMVKKAGGEDDFILAARAVGEVTEEAVLNSMITAHEIVGRDGDLRPALKDLLEKWNISLL